MSLWEQEHTALLLAITEQDKIEANHEYWLGRVAMELPTLRKETLVQLGQSAYVLFKSREEA